MEYYRKQYYKDLWKRDHGDKKYSSGALFYGYNMHPYVLIRLPNDNAWALLNIVNGKYWNEPQRIEGDSVGTEDLIRIGLDNNFEPVLLSGATASVVEEVKKSNNGDINLDDFIALVKQKNVLKTEET